MSELGSFWTNLPEIWYWYLVEICQEIPDLVKMLQKYRAFYTKTKFRLIVAGDIKSSQKLYVELKLYQEV
jgi:hypothetical protein